jgi:hypothetical protein
MTSASETISNLSNQINSRVRGRNRRGDYTSLPNSDSPYDREEVHPVSMESVQQRLRIHRATVKENEKREAVNEILDNSIDKSVQQSDTKKAASRIQAAIKRKLPAPKMIKEHYKNVDASAKLQAAAKGAIQRKQDRAVTNMGNLTDQLNETLQYGKSQTVLNEFSAKRQNISNFGKLSKGASDDLKERWVESIKGEQSRRKKISNFAKLTTGLKQQQHQQRLGIASVQPMSLETGTRSGAAFTATNEQLKTRLDVHRERNPELTQLRGQISDFKRGKLQLSEIQKSGIETRIQQLVEINKALRAKNQGPKLGRPSKK